MVNRPKVAGTRFESALVTYLVAHGFPYCERRALRGNRDGGDLLGLPGWVLEAKATRDIRLGESMAQAKIEAKNAAVSRYAVVHKRKNHGVAESYVTLPLHLFADLLADDVERNGSISRRPSNPPHG